MTRTCENNSTKSQVGQLVGSCVFAFKCMVAGILENAIVVRNEIFSSIWIHGVTNLQHEKLN